MTLLTWIFVVFSWYQISTANEGNHPNIVFILADDLGWDDVSFHGSKQIPTPNLDTLAYDGIILKNYHVQPICTPSRAALMTGRHPIHIGLQTDVIVGSEPYGLGLEEKILPEYLKELGYATHLVGKWHLGYFREEYCPTSRFFDSHYGYYQGMEDYWDHTYCARYCSTKLAQWGLDFRDNMTIVKDAYGQYSTELFTKRAEEIIDKHDSSTPLFMYFAHQAVHSGNPITPLEAPWKYLQHFDHIDNENRRLYAGMVSALDDSVGNVTKALERKGMLNNTIIIFSSDNGGPAAGFNWNMACNYPLRGVKASLWEGGHRSPGFIWSPLLEKSGYKYNNMIQIMDWLPTLLSAAGYNMSKLDPEKMDGFDQWRDLSLHQTSGPRTEFLHNINPKDRTSALRVNNLKLLKGWNGDVRKWSGWYKPGEVNIEGVEHGMLGHDGELVDISQMSKGALTADATAAYPPRPAPDQLFDTDLLEVLRSVGRNPIHPLRGEPHVVQCGIKPANASTNCNLLKEPCLYDIAADPCEYNNLAAERPTDVDELLVRLAEYEASMVKPRNKLNDPRGLPRYHDGVWVPWL